MCGIAGFTGRLGSWGESRKVLNKMLTRIRYRGPDEAGIFIDDEVSLGSVRLSIIDISSGHQPLCDDTGRYWITFNEVILKKEAAVFPRIVIPKFYYWLFANTGLTV
jgi:asparagine synthase (glutamine-hydrolysing)